MTTRTNLQIQFLHYHMRDMIVIMEEGNYNHPRLHACNRFVTWEALSHRHPTTSLCMWVAEWKLRRLEEEEDREGSKASFRLYW